MSSRWSCRSPASAPARRRSRTARAQPRSHVTVSVRTREFVWIEEIIDLVERRRPASSTGCSSGPTRSSSRSTPTTIRSSSRTWCATCQPSERRRAHRRLRGRVGELRVDSQPLGLRADRARQGPRGGLSTLQRRRWLRSSSAFWSRCSPAFSSASASSRPRGPSRGCACAGRSTRHPPLRVRAAQLDDLA